jgi:hypothetical protein
MSIYISYNFQNQIWNISSWNREGKSNINSVKNTKWHYWHNNLSLFVSLHVFSNFLLIIIWNINTHLMNTHIFVSNTFDTYKFEFYFFLKIGCVLIKQQCFGYKCHYILFEPIQPRREESGSTTHTHSTLSPKPCRIFSTPTNLS